jgi:rubrerythrin
MTTQPSGRRDFLAHAGLAAAGAAAVLTNAVPAMAATGRRRAPAGASDLDVLQVALALEHEGIAAYTIAAGAGLLTADVLKVASVFLGHHQGHRDSLAQLVQHAGGRPVEAKSNNDYVKELNLGALKSQADVLTLAARLELGAASAYVGQAGALRDKSLAKLFAGLAADEASHWAILNNAIGGTTPASAFIFGS